jgi:hypothetical protein
MMPKPNLSLASARRGLPQCDVHLRHAQFAGEPDLSAIIDNGVVQAASRL